jgi:hypothetical protein
MGLRACICVCLCVCVTLWINRFRESDLLSKRETVCLCVRAYMCLHVHACMRVRGVHVCVRVCMCVVITSPSNHSGAVQFDYPFRDEIFGDEPISHFNKDINCDARPGPTRTQGQRPRSHRVSHLSPSWGLGSLSGWRSLQLTAFTSCGPAYSSKPK